jgi:hypothetical protein
VTCHCSDNLSEWWQKFLSMPVHDKLFFWWGHSHEFEHQLGWDVLEKFAAEIAQAPVWHATNRDVYNYVQAWRGLVWTMDLEVVHNPSATPVWLLRDGELREIPAGATLRL